MVAFTLCALSILSQTLTVGCGKQFARIEDAVKVCHSRDVIEIFPKKAGYGETAIRLSTANIHILGMGARPTAIAGGNYDYSGVGSVPRAIFQFDPGSDGSTIENIELSGAHNNSYNGAGIRINQAKRITVKNCVIHDNDMGIMSNGSDGDGRAAEDQLIDHCSIYSNGNLKDPGFNHNLYLGGTSVTVQFCDIFNSITGHNLKSRAHFNLIRYCHIHHSANRELDLVEGWDTERPDSNTVLLGNLIEKDPACPGNKATIHFGAEHGSHDGSIVIVNNTIVTPFQSAVLQLSSSNARDYMADNIVFNPVQEHPILVEASGQARPEDVSGSHNWISKGYSLVGTAIDPSTRWQGDSLTATPGFAPAQYNVPKQPMLWIPGGYPSKAGLIHPGEPNFRYVGRGAWLPSVPNFIGAG